MTDQQVSDVLSDINDYDQVSLENPSVNNLVGGGYHPFDRQIGGADDNSYQSQDFKVEDPIKQEPNIKQEPTTWSASLMFGLLSLTDSGVSVWASSTYVVTMNYIIPD